MDNTNANDVLMGGEGIGAQYPKTRPKYQNPATVGGGLQTLAAIASRAGNEMLLTQGHHELAPKFDRRPMHPGHNPVLDRIMRPKLNGDEMVSQPMY
jgi:hypothetical protein